MYQKLIADENDDMEYIINLDFSIADIKDLVTEINNPKPELLRSNSDDVQLNANLGGRKLKRSSRTRYSKKSKKGSKKRSKKLKGGYLYRKRNKYQTLSSTRKSKQSKSKRKYFKY